MKRSILTTVGPSLALLLCLSVVYAGAAGQKLQLPSPGQKLVGTWDVTLRFPCGTQACPCLPGVTSDTRLQALHTYSGDGTIEEVYGGSLLLFRSDALGSWEYLRDQEYTARYKFFIFNPTTGERIFTEVVTSQINLQGKDAFEAAATFDRFEADGVTPVRTGCPINITGTRF